MFIGRHLVFCTMDRAICGVHEPTASEPILLIVEGITTYVQYPISARGMQLVSRRSNAGTTANCRWSADPETTDAGETAMKSRHYLSKAFAGIAALGAAATITCTAAMLDGLFPRGSTLAFLARTAPLAVVVPLVLAGFVIACDKFDAWLERRDEKSFGEVREAPNESTGHRPPQETRRVDRPVFASRLCFPNSVLDPSASLPLRARANRSPVRHAAKWLGQ
jgi:hypothetical protein